ncbi:cell envelope biogenesis protein OmpA [Flavobacterium branchiophilum NBRC 15030 = ATCC 35035]|uniref:OmpA family protein n=1 Tax=Flavobacterium branchiophilum TaxID=55197 RepID=A0A543G012_9FLAO|nr:OmpA family protein [Flavobacterium branchiophilum]OXA72079.1 cell envelope biogenesis protein OmpA [Flavobacterium branchiophilum NBRC 15030 = ATCC 35035]TQM39344.1 OmpA family protein [Flavobacterium branchiophilum]
MKKILCFMWMCFGVVVHAQESFSVYFDSNQYMLNVLEIKKLDAWMQQNHEVKIVGTNGFCDEDGSTGLNDTLAQKRIDFVYRYMQSKIKFRADFKTRNFGKLHQLSKIKAQNRRVTLYYILAKDLDKENDILGIKKEEVPLIKKKIQFPEKLMFENPNGSKTEMAMDTLFMKKINEAQVGEKLKIENLNFIINTFAVVNESRVKLYEILFVIQNNPQLKIEIQGHICCMPSDKQDLSTQRAKAIYQFLVANNIPKSQLSYKGFGSTKPIFSIPETHETERAANRRVEIEILDNRP